VIPHLAVKVVSEKWIASGLFALFVIGSVWRSRLALEGEAESAKQAEGFLRL
jgi:hypothetical protein